MEFLTKENLPQRFRTASLNSAILHHCLMLHKQGDVSYEEALQMAVVALVEDRARLVERLIASEKNRPPIPPQGVR